jgi:hypothetical protein
MSTTAWRLHLRRGTDSHHGVMIVVVREDALEGVASTLAAAQRRPAEQGDERSAAANHNEPGTDFRWVFSRRRRALFSGWSPRDGQG